MSEPAARVIADRGALGEIVPAWNALLDDSAHGGIFSTPEWQLSWLDALPGASPRCVVLSDTAGRLRALLPLALRTRHVGPFRLRALELGGEATACGDHLGFVARAGEVRDAWFAAAPVVRACAEGADLVRFASMDEAQVDALDAAAGLSAGWHACHPRDDVAPRILLPPGGSDVLDSFQASRRKKLRYYERHFASSHPSATIVLNDERTSLDAALGSLESLHAARWRERGESGVLADPSLMRFMRGFAARAHERGWLRLYQLIVDDQVVAALLTLHRRDVASGWLLGWSPEFAKWNVSELLWLHAVRVASTEGLRVFDFLRGNEAYKARFPVEPAVLACRQWTITTHGRLAVWTVRAADRVLASARRWRTRAQRVLRAAPRIRPKWPA